MRVVVAQLVEQFLSTPEVCGSNPVINKIYIEHCLLSTVLKRRKQRKRDRECPIKKLETFVSWIAWIAGSYPVPLKYDVRKMCTLVNFILNNI